MEKNNLVPPPDTNTIEDMEKQVPPLYLGRSFICHRDVNRALERHKEMYGVRLSLKKATKLENYNLKLVQLSDLNFRLKYGELIYNCSLANGRPGRPGNE